MPRACLFCALLLLAACERKTPTTAGEAAVPTPAARAKIGKPELATTGHGRIRNLHDDLRAEITAFEKQLAGGGRPPRWLVENQLKLADNLLAATQRAIDEEARLSVRHRAAALRRERGQLHAKRNDIYEEIRTIQAYLAEEAKGVGALPPGFTAEELRDRLGDKQEEARAIEEEIAGVQQRLKEAGDLLARETVPPQGVTLFTQEKEELAKLRQRIVALLDRLGPKDPPR